MRPWPLAIRLSTEVLRPHARFPQSRQDHAGGFAFAEHASPHVRSRIWLDHGRIAVMARSKKAGRYDRALRPA